MKLNWSAYACVFVSWTRKSWTRECGGNNASCKANASEARTKPRLFVSHSRMLLWRLRGCSHDTRMSFIPEWVSFQNEVRTAFTWQNRPAQPSWKRPFCPPFWKRYACATRPRLHGLRFHLGTGFIFILHDTRMKYYTRTRISFGLKTGMNSFQNDLCGDEISSWYHINRYGEIYGDGMNSFWNESHSGISM